jgi:IclR family transcriptional regulator, acetate operon repressor
MAEADAARETPTVRRSVVQSVTRALDILRLLRDAGEGLTAVEIANRLGLDRTVVHRLLKTLVHEGMACVDRGAYALGPAPVLMANRYVDNLLVRRLALPFLLDLQTNAIANRPWTISIVIPIDDRVAVIERIWTSTAPLDLVFDLGDTFPIETTAVGCCILAYSGEADARGLIGDARYEPVVSVLEQVRAGDGVVALPSRPATQSLGVVVRTRALQPVAAIAVMGRDLGEEFSAASPLAGHLRRAARAIGQSLR